MNPKTIALIVYCGMYAFFAQAEYREFTDAQGRTLSAELIRYNAKQKKVTLKCEGKGIKTVPISIFSETDQSYIISWNKNQDFLSDKTLKIECHRIKKKNTDLSSEYYYMSRKYYDFNYSVELENNSYTDFNNVTFEYVIFYSQDKHINNNHDIKEQPGTLYKTQVMDIPSRSTKELETDKVILYTYRESGYSEDWPDIRSEVDGIMIKLRLKSETGETISKTFTFPDNLNRVWTPKTKDVQNHPSN